MRGDASTCSFRIWLGTGGAGDLFPSRKPTSWLTTGVSLVNHSMTSSRDGSAEGVSHSYLAGLNVPQAASRAPALMEAARATGGVRGHDKLQHMPWPTRLPQGLGRGNVLSGPKPPNMYVAAL